MGVFSKKIETHADKIASAHADVEKALVIFEQAKQGVSAANGRLNDICNELDEQIGQLKNLRQAASEKMNRNNKLAAKFEAFLNE